MELTERIKELEKRVEVQRVAIMGLANNLLALVAVVQEHEREIQDLAEIANAERGEDSTA